MSLPLPLLRFLAMLALGALAFTVYAAQPGRLGSPPAPSLQPQAPHSQPATRSPRPRASHSPAPGTRRHTPEPGTQDPATQAPQATPTPHGLPLPSVELPTPPQVPLPTPPALPTPPPLPPTPAPTCIILPGVRICLDLPPALVPVLESARAWP